jgi:hypothetical protein
VTDIVERLRGNPAPGDHISKLIREAANEIERLRAALQQIEHETGRTMLATNHGRRGDIANEIARRALEPKP